MGIKVNRYGYRPAELTMPDSNLDSCSPVAVQVAPQEGQQVYQLQLPSDNPRSQHNLAAIETRMLDLESKLTAALEVQREQENQSLPWPCYFEQDLKRS